VTAKRLGLWLALCLTFSAAALHAQYVVMLPGIDNDDPTVTVLDSSAFSVLNTFYAQDAFELLSLPDGSQSYLIANINGAAITAMGPEFTNPQQIGNFPDTVNCGALSPDGSRLLAASSLLHIFDTGTNTDLTPNGIAIGQATEIIGVAVNYDSQTAFVLGTGTTNSYLATVSLGQVNAVTNTTTLTGLATQLALGPDGLVYIGLPNQVLEINPATMAPTPGGTMAVPATPGDFAFTPDGLYALTVNTAAVNPTDAAVVLIDLTNHVAAGDVPFATLQAPFDTLFTVSTQLVYAYSGEATSVYTVQVGANGGIILNIPPFPDGIPADDIEAMGFSTDLGIPNRTAPQYLFLLSEGTLYRVDPMSLTLGEQTFLESSPTLISYFTPTATGNDAYTALTFGDNQTVPAGGTTLPLVVQILDQNGLPISGVGVNFSPDTGTIVNPNVATGANGFAEAIYTAGTGPNDMGAINITVTAGDLSQSFTVNVGTTPSEVTPASLTIVSGQGQVVFEDNPTGLATGSIAPFTVQALDDSGNPVPNALVSFAVSSGTGSLTGSAGSGQSTQVEADDNGNATVTFVPPLVFWTSPGFETDTIVASAGTGTATLYINTVAEDSSYCATPPCVPPLTALRALVLTPAVGANISGAAGSTIPNAVQISVNSTFGPPIPNVGLQVSSPASGTGTNTTHCADPTGANTALTNASGIATCNLVLNGLPGTNPLIISVPVDTYDGSLLQYTGYTVTISVGAASTINTISGDNQAGLSGMTLPQPFVAQVTDAAGNPVPGAPLTWTVTSGSMALVNPPTATDANGNASVSGIPRSPGGTVITLQVTSGAASDSFTIYVIDPAASITSVSGDGQSAPINTAFANPLVVQLTDASGNPAPYGTVTFTVTTGSASIDNPSVMADQNGMASTTLTAGSAGPLVVKAANGKLNVSFNLTVLPAGPTNLTVVNSANYTSSISPGSLVSILGEGVTPTITGVITDQTQFEGYSVNFGTVSAPMIALINQNGIQQINIQVPFEVTSGDNDVTIQTPLGSTDTDVQVSNLSPGIFTSGTLTFAGQSYPLAVVLRSDGSYASAADPVQAGETITFFATGLGQTAPPASTGVPGVPGQLATSPIYAGINHQSVAVISAIYAPNALGLFEITVQIPGSTPSGPAQPVSLFTVDSQGNSYNAPDAYVPIVNLSSSSSAVTSRNP
jgi:uncharacterized protein (TIGR03437 family)